MMVTAILNFSEEHLYFTQGCVCLFIVQFLISLMILDISWRVVVRMKLLYFVDVTFPLNFSEEHLYFTQGCVCLFIVQFLISLMILDISWRVVVIMKLLYFVDVTFPLYLILARLCSHPITYLNISNAYTHRLLSRDPHLCVKEFI